MAGDCSAALDSVTGNGYTPRMTNLRPLTEYGMRHVLRRAIDGAGGVRAYSRRAGLAASVVSRANRGTIPVPPGVLSALHLTRVISYRSTTTPHTRSIP